MDLKIADAAQKLNVELAAFDRVAIAFSGGCDSMLLAESARLTLGGDRVLLLTAVSNFFTAAELARVRRYAKMANLRCEEVRLTPLDHPEIAENSLRRCYFCKHYILENLASRAAKLGFAILADGANADDFKENPPGLAAAAELKVVHPLRALNKTTIREMARELGVETWNLPAAACLATRIPTGTAITGQLLERICQAESALAQFGFTRLRVRAVADNTAKIEVESDEVSRAEVLLPQLAGQLAAFGFTRCTVGAYRRGAMNILPPEQH